MLLEPRSPVTLSVLCFILVHTWQGMTRPHACEDHVTILRLVKGALVRRSVEWERAPSPRPVTSEE